MSDHLISSLTAISLAVIGVAILAVLVSNQSKTGAVLGAGGSSLGNMISCAMSPITGAKCGTGRSLLEDVNSTITF